MEVKKGLTGFHLKLIALITMTIDHTAASIVQRMHPEVMISFSADSWSLVYTIMRVIGRMAFPIYCFLLVEGFHYTSNRKKYAQRMLLFLVISEIPFDLCLSGKWIDWSYNNVFCTLFLGLLTMWMIEAAKGKIEVGVMDRKKQLLSDLSVIGITAAMAIVALLAHTDYDAAGILAIVVLYVKRDNRMVGMTLAIIVLGLTSSLLEFYALLILIPIAFYNGQRGRQMKYFFYAFYPGHLIVLCLICLLMGLPLLY